MSVNTNKEIKTVSIIGLGALGILIGHRFSKRMKRDDLRIIADKKRIERYTKQGVFCNGERCVFNYVLPDAVTSPSDLVVFSVKYGALNDAVKAVKNQFGRDTIFISLLNGITSEKVIAQTFPREQVLFAVAQGMDAVKEGNELSYENSGTIYIGSGEQEQGSERVLRIAAFFEKMGLPYEIDKDIKNRIWGKFMLNVGINQAIAVFGQNYSDAQKDGKTRDVMISAMHEVIPLAKKEGVAVTSDDIPYWLDVISALNPDGKPSMRQDVEAKRPSEVEMLAGTVLELSKKYGLRAPVNEMLYERIKALEEQF